MPLDCARGDGAPSRAAQPRHPERSRGISPNCALFSHPYAFFLCDIIEVEIKILCFDSEDSLHREQNTRLGD